MLLSDFLPFAAASAGSQAGRCVKAKKHITFCSPSPPPTPERGGTRKIPSHHTSTLAKETTTTFFFKIHLAKHDFPEGNPQTPATPHNTHNEGHAVCIVFCFSAPRPALGKATEAHTERRTSTQKGKLPVLRPLTSASFPTTELQSGPPLTSQKSSDQPLFLPFSFPLLTSFLPAESPSKSPGLYL